VVTAMVVLMVSSTTTATIRRHNCNDGDDDHHYNDDNHDDDDEYIYSRASTSEMNKRGLRVGLLCTLHALKRLKASAATKK